MRIASLAFAVCFFLAMASCPPAFAQSAAGTVPGIGNAQGGPLAEVPEKVHDFGKVFEGKEYVHNFIVKNVGDAPLEIKKVIKI